jgi:hypothetical protein
MKSTPDNGVVFFMEISKNKIILSSIIELC